MLVHQFQRFFLFFFFLIFIICKYRRIHQGGLVQRKYLEESCEDIISYVKATVVVLVADIFAFTIGQQVRGRRGPAILVYLDRHLIGAKRH